MISVLGVLFKMCFCIQSHQDILLCFILTGVLFLPFTFRCVIQQELIFMYNGRYGSRFTWPLIKIPKQIIEK